MPTARGKRSQVSCRWFNEDSAVAGATVSDSAAPAPAVLVTTTTKVEMQAGPGLARQWGLKNMMPYPLFPRVCDVPVGFEEGSDVEGLASPQVTVDGPVEGQLQGAPIKRPMERAAEATAAWSGSCAVRARGEGWGGGGSGISQCGLSVRHFGDLAGLSSLPGVAFFLLLFFRFGSLWSYVALRWGGGEESYGAELIRAGRKHRESGRSRDNAAEPACCVKRGTGRQMAC